MKSIKFALPPLPIVSRARRRWPYAVGVGLVAGMLGLAATTSLAPPSAPIGWLIGRPVNAEENGQRVEVLVGEAERHMRRGEFAGAIKRYDEALRSGPTRVTSYRGAVLARYLQGERQPPPLAEILPDPAGRMNFLLALAADERERGHLADAQETLTQAIALAPDDPRGHVGLGGILESREDWQGALASYEQALRLDPQNLAAGAARITLLYRQGELDVAVAEVRRLYGPLVASSREPEIQVGLLEAYMHQNLPLADIRRRFAHDAPAFTPSERMLLLARAYLRHYRVNPNWNRDSFDRVLEVCRELELEGIGATERQRHEAARLLSEVHAARGKRFFERGDIEASRAEFERALRQAPLLPEDKLLRADLQAERARLLTLAGKTTEAQRAREAALLLVPEHPCKIELARTQASLGATLLAAGKTVDSLAHLQKALHLLPTDEQLLARTYVALTVAKRPTPLVACARAIGSGTPDDNELFQRLARGLGRLGKTQEVRELVAIAGRSHLTPQTLAAVGAEAAAAAGDRTTARAELLRALEHQPSPSLWHRLGTLELERAAQDPPSVRPAHLGQALDAFRHALATAPVSPPPPAFASVLEVTADLATLALQQGDVAQAQRYALEGTLLQPSHPGLGALLAESLMRQGQLEGARIACVRALRGLNAPNDPAHAPLCERLSSILRKQKRFGEAIAVIKEGLAPEVEASPAACASLHFTLAFAHAENGQREEALNAVRQYVFWSIHDKEQTARVTAAQELELSLMAPGS